jgi:hypothetical protein
MPFGDFLGNQNPMQPTQPMQYPGMMPGGQDPMQALIEMFRKKKMQQQQPGNIFSQGGQQQPGSELNQGGDPQTITNEGMGQQMTANQTQYQTPWSQNYTDPWAQSSGLDYQGGGMMAVRNKRDFEGVGMESMQSPYTASGYY